MEAPAFWPRSFGMGVRSPQMHAPFLDLHFVIPIFRLVAAFVHHMIAPSEKFREGGPLESEPLERFVHIMTSHCGGAMA